MKKFDNIVIATDLDGTFFGKGGLLVDRNLKAIQYFINNGGKFTIASGRVLYNVIKAFPDIDKYVNMPIIVCDGASVYDINAGKALKNTVIPYKTVRQVLDFVHDKFPSVGVRIGTENYAFVSSPEEMSNPYIKEDYLKCHDDTAKLLIPFDRWNEIDIIKIVLCVPPSSFNEIFASIIKEFSDIVSPTFSCDYMIDIQMKGVNKGTALKSLVKNSCGDGVKLYACGDYVNDREMLLGANVSVCPSNAHQSIKSMCDLRLCSNDEGIIAELVEHIELCLTQQ